jgi:hypothetical protein
MSCQNLANNPTPICDGPAILIYMQPAGAALPSPIWVTATCVDGAITAFNYFSDEAATVPAVGFSIADRVPTPADARGLSCDSALATNLCPATLSAVEQFFADQTAADDANTAEILAALAIANREYAYSGFVYNVDGNLTQYSRQYSGGPVQTRTFTYTGTELTAVSDWV